MEQTELTVGDCVSMSHDNGRIRFTYLGKSEDNKSHRLVETELGVFAYSVAGDIKIILLPMAAVKKVTD